VLRPELYELFMSAWEDHISNILSEPDLAMRLDSRDLQGGIEIDPELQAHFSRAYDILEQLGRKVPRSELKQRVVESAGFTILSKPDGQIVAAGQAARSVLDESSSLSALNDHLTANGVRMLEDLCEKAEQAQDGAHSPIVLTTDIQPRHLIARIAFDEGAPVQVLLEGLDYRWTAEAEQMLVTSFGLSRAEVDVVRNLMAGYTLRRIAEISQRSEHTVRNQAKSVLAKTGAPGQADLIRLVAFLIDNEDRAGIGHPGVVMVQSQMLAMETGLNMQVFECGDPLGYPVLYLHGMLDGMAPLEYLQDQFAAHGLRVIAPVRPGYGLSDGVVPPEEAVELVVRHVDELISRLKLVRPVVLGHMAGALHGHFVCKRLKDRVAGMVAVAGGGPVLRMKQISKMAPRQRVMAYTARFAPALLPFFVRAGVALVDSDEIGQFMDSLYKPGSHERTVVDRLGVAELMHAGYRFAVQSGPTGFVSDGHMMVRNWLPEIEDSKTPVLHLHGGRDPVIPACATERFTANYDHMEFRMFPEAGQFLIYERPDVVLKAIDDLITR
jgi:pimeloyl-ACP methyl ester carboxylesterase